jgi:hypothetical protein
MYSITTLVKYQNYVSRESLIANIQSGLNNFINIDLYVNFSEIVLRLLGPQQIILSSQHLNDDPLAEVYSFLFVGESSYNLAKDLYGLDFGDRALGVGMGLPSVVVLSTNGDAIYMLPISVAIVLFFSILNKVVLESKQELNYNFALIFRFTSFMSVFFLNQGNWVVFVGSTLLILGLFCSFSMFSLGKE